MCSPVCESPSKSGPYLRWLFQSFIQISNIVLCSLSQPDGELCNEFHPTTPTWFYQLLSLQKQILCLHIEPFFANLCCWTNKPELCIANVFLAWKSTIHTELYGFSGTWLSKIDLSLPCACTHTETSSGSYLWDKLSRRCQHGCCESTGLQSFHPKGRYGKPV